MNPRALRRRSGLLLALALGGAGLLLLGYLASFDTPGTALPRPVLIAVVAGLALLVIITLVLLLREVIRAVWQAGIEQFQAAALAEQHRFLRRLDHELKNPLTAVRAGLASLALTLKDDQQRATVATLMDDTRRLSGLVTNLRKLLEIDVVQLDIQTMMADDLSQHLREILDDHPLSQSRSCAITPLSGPSASMRVRCDLDLLLLAAHNLFDNALKYSREGDQVALRFRVQAADFVFEVADTGIGIAPDDQPHVWEELYRGANVGAIEGMGIGLAMVRRIIDRHYGSIVLTSELGRGTTITLAIPLA